MDSKPEVDLTVGTRHVIFDKYVAKIMRVNEHTVVFTMDRPDLPDYGLMTEVSKYWFVAAVNYGNATSDGFRKLAATPSPVQCAIKDCDYPAFGSLTSELRICPFHTANLYSSMEEQLISSGRVVLADGQFPINWS